MKTAKQALLHLHSIPVRFYTKAGRDQNTDCNKYCGPPCPDGAAGEGEGKVSERHHRLLLGLRRDSALPLTVCGDVRGGAAVAVRGLGPLYI